MKKRNRLWHLYPVNANDERWGWDCNHGFVIRAPDEKTARKIAAEHLGDEGEDSWLSPTFSRCEELKAEGRTTTILCDFNAG